MKRRICGVIFALLGLAACAHLSTDEMSSLRREFGALLGPRFEIAHAGVATPAELRALLGAVQQAKASGQEHFDALTGLDFESATKADVRFTWSGGFHGGSFTVEKRAGVWIVTDEAYLL